jgi:hypothetical protein
MDILKSLELLRGKRGRDSKIDTFCGTSTGESEFGTLPRTNRQQRRKRTIFNSDPAHMEDEEEMTLGEHSDEMHNVATWPKMKARRVLPIGTRS